MLENRTSVTNGLWNILEENIFQQYYRRSEREGFCEVFHDKFTEFGTIYYTRGKPKSFKNSNEELIKFHKKMNREMESISVNIEFSNERERNITTNKELGKLALNLYTLHGIAHLIHVAWAIAQHIIWNIECIFYPFYTGHIEFNDKWQCSNQNWLEHAFNIVRESNMFPSKKSEILRSELIEMENNENSSSTETEPHSPGQQNEGVREKFIKIKNTEINLEEKEQSYYTDLWFWFYFNMEEEKDFRNQAPTQGEDENKKFFTKLMKNLTSKTNSNKKGKNPIKNMVNDVKGKVKMTEIDENNLHKILIKEKCGHWLSIMWFGLKTVLFGLGWMLLSLHYYIMD
uniref:Uncharacterized protein n=1 Tax=Meloidogyne hapla TaxID=6305 RepID=A0A1I8BN90_MELHA